MSKHKYYPEKECVECGKLFIPSRNAIVTCSAFCQSRRAYKRRSLNKAEDPNGVIKKRMNKLKEVLRHNRICPGCGYQFPNDKRILLMIFELSHKHNTKCHSHDSGGYFYSCRDCNAKTARFCGIWEKPGLFKKIHENNETMAFDTAML